MYRGGFGMAYRVRLRNGNAVASFMIDHGRFAPFSVSGGAAGAMTEIDVSQDGRVTHPAHVSKGSGYELRPGDWIEVRTPGGGGWGDPSLRDPTRIARDVQRGYLSPADAAADYGFLIDESEK